ncbi:hypothetical protein [Brasilonema sp. UFV-L1]|uniref:hypothetical protein n=1 Tax=Brasilonema sp. UFV-L1 TaxID=2234130 RepID=UPI00145C93E7|nr:hypothetical protein [Brasilonema sp. UFV-L1]NMG06156.1 hypothetical protein [Brasilonema sp. UFV-L1]
MNLVILIAALIVAFLVFRALLSLLQTALSTAIAIFLIVVILMFFGFSPQDLLQEINNLPEILNQFITQVKKILGL